MWGERVHHDPAMLYNENVELLEHLIQDCWSNKRKEKSINKISTVSYRQGKPFC